MSEVYQKVICRTAPHCKIAELHLSATFPLSHFFLLFEIFLNFLFG